MSLKNFIKKTKRILAYAKPYWKLLAILFIVSIFLTIVSLFSPYIVKILIDNVLLGHNYKLLLYLMLLFIFLFFMKSIIGVVYAYQTTKLSENIVLDVKLNLFEHLEDLDMSFYHKKKVGDILFRLDEDVYAIDDFIGILIDDILMNVLSAIFILAICLYLNWKITLASLTFFPFYIIAQKYYGDKIREKKKVILKKASDMLSFLEEAISAIKLIKTFVLESIEKLKYKRKSKRLIKLDLDMTLLESYADVVIGLITFVPMLIILWYGSYQVMTGIITLGTLIAIYTYIGRLFGPISDLGSINIAIQSTMVSINRIFSFMDIKSKIKNSPNAVPVKDIKGDIQFQNVDFYYNKEEPVLCNMDFEISPKERVGLVGPSGSGKTTTANLIYRFFDPVNGKILLDGKDVKGLDLYSLRRNIGFVTQEPIMLNTTIKENIKLGNLAATDRDVIKAAKLAYLHNFIKTLEKGYDTVVGERGIRLSGGEKQRLSIARVILKNPKIIIMDEGTSSLDSETEQKIHKALDYVTKDKTTLIIAHRLTTLRNVDRIFVLGNGAIAEQGSFPELMSLRGEFFRYYKAQFSGLQNFKQNIEEEINRARTYNKNLVVSELKVRNLKGVIKKISRQRTTKLLEKINSLLEQNIRTLDSVYLDSQKNKIYLLMPETNKRNAKEILDILIAFLKSETKKINYQFKTYSLREIRKLNI